METFAQRLEKLMRYYDLKQTDIAEYLGISRSRVCSYLKGTYLPKSDVIYKLAEKFNVDEAWLIGYEMPMFKTSAKYTDLQNATIQYILALPEDKLKAVYELIRRL